MALDLACSLPVLFSWGSGSAGQISQFRAVPPSTLFWSIRSGGCVFYQWQAAPKGIRTDSLCPAALRTSGGQRSHRRADEGCDLLQLLDPIGCPLEREIQRQEIPERSG